MAKSMQCHLFHLGSCQVCLYLSRVGNLVLHTISSFSEWKVSIPLLASLPAPITSTTMSVFPFVSCLTPGSHLALCRPLNTKYNSSVGCWRAYLSLLFATMLAHSMKLHAIYPVVDLLSWAVISLDLLACHSPSPAFHAATASPISTIATPLDMPYLLPVSSASSLFYTPPTWHSAPLIQDWFYDPQFSPSPCPVRLSVCLYLLQKWPHILCMCLHTNPLVLQKLYSSPENCADSKSGKTRGEHNGTIQKCPVPWLTFVLTSFVKQEAIGTLKVLIYLLAFGDWSPSYTRRCTMSTEPEFKGVCQPRCVCSHCNFWNHPVSESVACWRWQ